LLVLALDTALSACSAALVEFEGERDEVRAAESEPRERGHAEALMPMVERVMGGTPMSSVDRFAVTAGPGSFTGLRVGLAAARAFALASAKPALGVGTLAAIAAPGFGEDLEPVLAVMDARRGEAYWQLFALPGRPLTPAIASSYAEIAHLVDSPHVRLAGSGAERLAAEDPGRFHVVSTAETPDILWVARLGARLDPESAPPDPLYIRSPDAKIQPERAIANAAESEPPWPPPFTS